MRLSQYPGIIEEKPLQRDLYISLTLNLNGYSYAEKISSQE